MTDLQPKERSNGCLAAIGAIAFLLPILAGGNFFVALEPAAGVALFDIVAVAVAGILVRSREFSPPVEYRRATWCAGACLLALFLWWSGMLVLRSRGPRALLEAQAMFAAILLFASLSMAPLRAEALWSFARGLLVGTLVTTLYGQYQYWVAFPRTVPLAIAAGIPVVTMINANFYNANCYAAFLTATILLTTGLGMAHRDIWRSFAAAALLPLLVTLLLTESRSTIVMLAVVAAAWGLLRIRTDSRRMVRRRFLWGSLFIAALLGVFIATVDLGELWKFGLVGRIAIWRGSLAMIREHWLLGVGLGRFWDYFPSYRVTSYYTRYPHSFLLEIFAASGVVGGMAMVGFLSGAAVIPVQFVARLWGGFDREQAGPFASAVAACALLIAHGLVDIDWHAPANPILLFVLLGFAQHLPIRKDG